MKRVRLNNLTQLDKVIITNLKMIENEIGIVCCLSLCALFSFLMIMLIVGIPFEVALAIYFLIKAYKKVFYTSIYGETAIFYNALPINPKDMVVGKITAVFIGTLIYTVVSILCFIPFLNIWQIIRESLNWAPLNNSNAVLLTAALSLELLSLLAVSLAMITVVFLCVSLYMENKALRIPYFRKGLFIAFGFIVSETILNIATLADAVGIKYGLYIPVLQIVAAIGVTYFAGKKTIAVFDNKGNRG